MRMTIKARLVPRVMRNSRGEDPTGWNQDTAFHEGKANIGQTTRNFPTLVAEFIKHKKGVHFQFHKGSHDPKKVYKVYSFAC